MRAGIQIRKNEKTRRIGAVFILLFCVCAAFAAELIQSHRSVRTDTDGFLEYAGLQAQESLYRNVMDYYLPAAGAAETEPSLAKALTDAVLSYFPVCQDVWETVRADSQAQSLSYELERQMLLENQASYAEESGAGQSSESYADVLQQSLYAQMQGNDMAAGTEQSLFSYATEKQAKVDLAELSDYETLVQKHYRIDGTTAGNAKQLNVKKLLKKDLSVARDAAGPQILIYHTHSLEGYRDSESGDLNESVVGVGDYLTKILTERYGYEVLHDRGTYDSDRDHAYGVAGPALEKILAEHPTIEVVIDLHRDGVGEDTYLLTEVNDTVMAPVMFFNGLSYTKSNGALSSLANPNLSDNLAFSLQMELIAAEYYPNFSRGIYLKGLRYNLHYCPKSLLVEVGAQTNTLQEAMNAMPPLADVLNRVLSGEKP